MEELDGEEDNVVFRQVHEPGRLGLSDFTEMGSLGVTVGGVSLEHRLYHSQAREDLTSRDDALCAHYGMQPTRNIGAPRQFFSS